MLTASGAVDGSRRLAWVEWDLTTPVGDETTRHAAFDRGALGTAAQLVGLARRMLDLTVEYAKARQQFGVPIGSFQAVKHHLADSRIAIEFARPLVYRAAWSITEGDPDASTHVSMAKALASDAATLTAGQALQCHGAIGYSYEYDLHLFMKRAWALAATWGDAAWHRARVGRAIL
jgi:alkylation response protein AidB-like acyl-CoA dehydrogenase